MASYPISVHMGNINWNQAIITTIKKNMELRGMCGGLGAVGRR